MVCKSKLCAVARKCVRSITRLACNVAQDQKILRMYEQKHSRIAQADLRASLAVIIKGLIDKDKLSSRKSTELQ